MMFGCAALLADLNPVVAARGELEIRVTDSVTGDPIAVQLQLTNQRGRRVQPADVARNGDWLVFDGQTVLRLPPGAYTFRLQRGLEYRERTGNFLLKSGAADLHEVTLPRFVDMASEGWWSGDLQVMPKSRADLTTCILASDLHVIPLIDRNNHGQLSLNARALVDLQTGIGTGRTVECCGAEDRRLGSQVIVFSESSSVELPPADQTLPTPFDIVREIRTSSSPTPHIHLAHASCWDLPTWIGLGLIDSLGLMHDGLAENESTESFQDRPRDRVLFPDPDGIGRWSQQIYFRLLESGIRLPPGAGSGTASSGNPMGAARTYVHCGERLAPSTWWEGLRAGRVLITNGPMLRPRVNGKLPGHVFQLALGESLELDVQLNLATQDKIRYLEIIQNGRPVHQVRLEDWVAQDGRLPPIRFDASGWMLIRAVADHPTSFRAAMSGPYFVEMEGQPRISRLASQFFLDWVYEVARRLRLDDPDLQRAVLDQHRHARDFWQQQVQRATVQ